MHKKSRLENLKPDFDIPLSYKEPFEHELTLGFVQIYAPNLSEFVTVPNKKDMMTQNLPEFLPTKLREVTKDYDRL